MYKNVAQKLAVYAYDVAAADAPKTGDAGNITAQISKDGGATNASNDVNPTELDATDAKGIYIFDLLQAETNCDLFILSAVSSTGSIRLDPVIAYTTDDLTGDTSTYDPSNDGLQAIRDAITAAADVTYVPDSSSTVTDGTVQGGSYASAASDDGTRWIIQLETDNDTNVDVTCEFNMGSGRIATEVGINGYYDAGAQRACQVYAWNYTTTSWDKLSSAGVNTEMRNRSTDKDYLFSLTNAHTDRTTTPGEVKIRFYTDGGGSDEDDLHLDYVYIDGAAAGGVSPAAIADAVHSELDAHLTHIPCFTGDIRYVHATNGNDANSGEYPGIAFATIGGAVAASSAGDMIRVFASTYSEAVVLAANGLELWCEIGTDIDGNGGVPLTISGNGCRVIGAHFDPDAGQIGCIVSGADVYLELCESHATGLTAFQFATTAERCQVIACVASDFTSVGFEVKGPDSTFERCLARGNGGTETGFHLSDTLAHRNHFNLCATVDCATAGWDADAGADDNLFTLCADSVGCGAKVDAGANNSWREFMIADLTATNATYIGATAQTGRDIGASVLLSAGTGAGQLRFTSGVVKSNLSQILGTALTESAGYLAAAFEKFFNIGTPLLTVADAMADATAASQTTILGRLGAGLDAEDAATKLDSIQDSSLDFTSARGTLTADGTEQSIYENASPSAEWVPENILVDLSNMEAGDITTIKAYLKVKSGGSYILMDTQTYSAVQSVQGIITLGTPNRYGFKITLQQSAGTNRDYDWERFNLE